MSKEQRDIEWLIWWALVKQGMAGTLNDKPGRAGFAELGTRVQESRGSVAGPSIALNTDDDAMLIRDMILALPVEAREVIVRYGRTGLQPDWCEEGVGSMQQKTSGGRPMWQYENPNNRRSARTPVMEWVGWRRHEVEAWRAEWRLWWMAMHDMVDPLNRVMDNHVATRPRVPLEPWADAKEQAKSKAY